MIEQKDIDRLLAGRKIIDGIQRIDTAVLQEKYAIIKPDQLSSLTKTEIITAKADVDSLYEAEKLSILDAEKKLTDMGFNGISGFMEFNRQMCIAENKERLEITRVSCDGCPTKRCVELYKNSACFYSTGKEVPEEMYYFFIQLRMKSADSKFDDVKVCPDGYGFHWKTLREPQFELGWK